jgi:peptide/nickel transport system permease protein
VARHFLWRGAFAVVVLLLVTVVAFFIIELPPGDYVTDLVARLRSSGAQVTLEMEAALRHQYGVDRPIHVRYLLWMGKMIRGEMGLSYEWRRPVRDLIGERLPLSIMISILTLIVTYAIAIPIGIYSATRQYSWGDYTATVLGYAGVSVPSFLLALILMLAAQKWFGLSIGGLFTFENKFAPWSWGKFLDLLTHLPIPLLVIGLSGTAGVIRVMRGVLLDELQKQYVMTARAKGVAEQRLLFKYPVRIALNPIVSTVSFILPAIVSGETIVAIVMSLDTMGPLLFSALITQDTFLAASGVMVLSFLTVLGAIVADALLVWVDPRIRLEGKTA